MKTTNQQVETDKLPVGMVILAAGASTRMGTPKQLLPYQGRSLLRHTVEVGLASECRPIMVVLGAYSKRIEPEIIQLPVQVVENYCWSEGMSSSIRVGMKALFKVTQNLEALVITLCDQPFIFAGLINQLIETYFLTRKKIIATEYADTLGVPALFSSTVFPELMSLPGTVGAKHLIRKYPHVSVPFQAGAIDIDTPFDYEKLRVIGDHRGGFLP